MISTTRSVANLKELPSKDPFQFVALSEVESVPIEWLWRPYIPRGALTIIMGDGGYGKSWMTCAIAADLSQGRALPGQEAIPPQRVLMVSAEDGLSQVIKPKMELLQADMTRIQASDRGFVLSGDAMKHLVKYITDYDVAIVFFDPLVVYLGGHVDTNRANEVRSMLSLLVDVAKGTNTAIVAVHHVRKGGDGPLQHKVMGSADFVNGVRSTLLVDVAKGGQRFMAHVKSNWAANGPSLAYNFGAKGFTWQGQYEGKADEVHEVSRIRRGTVEAWIKDALKHGPMPAADMLQGALDQGFSERTLSRAKNGLVRSYNTNGQWFWELEPVVLELVQVEDEAKMRASVSPGVLIGQIAAQDGGLRKAQPQTEDALQHALRVMQERRTKVETGDDKYHS